MSPPDGLQKWNPESSSYLKVVNTWKSPKISELYFQKIPWKITNLKRNFVILDIINSIFSLKNDGISFVLLIELWMAYAVSMKSIIWHITGDEAEFSQNPPHSIWNSFMLWWFKKLDFSWLGYFRGNLTWQYSIRGTSMKYIYQ